MFWSLLWGIWLRKNAWFFEQKRTQIDDVIQKAVNVVGEFAKANEKVPSDICSRQPVLNTWMPHATGLVKAISDAACFMDSSAGLGGVICDHVGDVMAATLPTCCELKGSFAVDVLEVLAARHTLSIALDAGLNKVILETDNLKLYHHFARQKEREYHFWLYSEGHSSLYFNRVFSCRKVG